MRPLNISKILSRDLGQADNAPALRHSFGLALLIIGLAYAQLAVGIEVARIIGVSGPSPGWGELCRWDCGWYVSIVHEGYHLMPIGHERMDAANWAFWPLFPLAIRLTMWMTGLELLPAALLMNAMASFLMFWTFLHHGECMIVGLQRRAAFLCMFVSSPFFFYLQVPYTEALFNLFLLLSFIAWNHNQLAYSAAAGAFLTSLRVNGIFWPLALAAMILIRQRFRLGRVVARNFWQCLAIAAMPLGAISYMVYLGRHTGDMLAFSHIQIAWDRTLSNPFEMAWTVLHRGNGTERYWLIGGLMALIPVVYLLFQRSYFAIALVMLTTFLIAVSTGVGSTPRYLWTFIFIYIPLWQVISLNKPFRNVSVVIIMMFMGKLYLIYSWFNEDVWVI